MLSSVPAAEVCESKWNGRQLQGVSKKRPHCGRGDPGFYRLTGEGVTHSGTVVLRVRGQGGNSFPKEVPTVQNTWCSERSLESAE